MMRFAGMLAVAAWAACAAGGGLEVVYPAAAENDADRLAWLFHAQEKLRRHNNAAVAKLKPAEAVAWHRSWFRPRNAALSAAIVATRAQVYPGPAPKDATGDHTVPWAEARAAVRAKADDHADLAAVDLDACFTGSAPRDTLVDPAEDFTTYSEVDPSGHIDLYESLVDVNAIAANEDCYAYSDKGAAHFGNFTHYVKATYISGGGQNTNWHYPLFWGVSNVVNDWGDWWSNTREALFATFAVRSSTSTERIYLWSAETADYDYAEEFGVGTPYWFTASRSSTLAQLDIYTDLNRTIVFGTIDAAVVEGRTFRYVFAANIYNAGLPETSTLDVENLDLNEGGAGAAVVQSVQHARRRRQ